MYFNNKGFALCVRKLMALAFLNGREAVLQGFEMVSEEFEEVVLGPNANDNFYRIRVDKLLKYFAKQWLSNVDVWNVYKVCIRTNNCIEGWHNRMRIKLHSLDLFYYIEQLIEEELNRIAEHVACKGEYEVPKEHDAKAKVYEDMFTRYNGMNQTDGIKFVLQFVSCREKPTRIIPEIGFNNAEHESDNENDDFEDDNYDDEN